MTIYVLFPIILTISACLVAAYLIGEAELDDILRRWHYDTAMRAPRRTPEPTRLRLVRDVWDWEARGL